MILKKTPQRENEPGSEFRRKLYEDHGYWIEKYNGRIVEDDTNKDGSVITINVDGALLRIVLGRRDWGVQVQFPASKSCLDGWHSTLPIIHFISDLEGVLRPMSGAYFNTPEALERILQFYKRKDFPKLCLQYDEWYKHWAEEGKKSWRKKQQAKRRREGESGS